MVTIMDYRMGNARSVVSMLARVGVEAELTSDPARIARARKLVLPGVGAFDDGVRNLAQLGITPVLQELLATSAVPFLGICLGMQLLADSSEEDSLRGLGLIKGRVVRFRPSDPSVKVPHMGWNTAIPVRPHYLLQGLDTEARFYFGHSYHFTCERVEDALTQTHYDGTFTSAVSCGCVAGVQFHPERSLRWGLRVVFVPRGDAPALAAAMVQVTARVFPPTVIRAHIEGRFSSQIVTDSLLRLYSNTE